jgi:hypothetical protein
MSDDDPCGELPNWTCLNGACQCEPNCDGKMCGDNGCGAACGACGADEECDGGTCSCALFETTPGGSTEDEGASGIAVGIDGSFLVAGSQHVGGLTVARVTRISATGDDLGSQVFGLSGDRELRAIVPSPGGGFALAGYLTLDEVDGGRQAWLVLVTEELSVITEKTFGGELADEAQSVTALADGGYLLTGFTTTVDQGTDLWLARVDGAGETVFEAVFGGPKDDEGYHAIEISGDRLAVVGYTKSFSNGAEDAWLLLTDSAGIELDNITVGGAGEERARYVLETSGGEVFATGVSFGAALGAPEIWILRLNADGNVAWVKSYGGETLDSGAVIVETADNGLVIAGQSSLADGTNSEFRLVKILPDGETVVWDRSWGLEGDDSIRGLAVLPDGGFATCGIRGETTVSPGGDDVWVARLNQWGERACGCGDGACDGDEVCESCAVDCCP